MRGFRHRTDYLLTRFVLLRALAFVYVVAFWSLSSQLLPLIGSDGLMPAEIFLDAVQATSEHPRWELPTIFWWDASGTALQSVCAVGLLLSIVALMGFDNCLVWLVMWGAYLSLVHVGQTFYGYGWEILLLEAGFLAVFLASPWTMTPLALPRPHPMVMVMFRWLVFRVMLGAGLIKIRGDPCWTDLSCLSFHYETQPNPHPLSWAFHHAPDWFHQVGVLFNHFVELIVPWGVFGPQRLRWVCGLLIIFFQVLLIASGNLSFLNWLTIAVALSCFDDDFYGHVGRGLRALRHRQRRFVGQRSRARARREHSKRGGASTVRARSWFDEALRPVAACRVGVRCFVRKRRREARETNHGRLRQGIIVVWALVVVALSLGPVLNLLGSSQRMNASFDPLHWVNTYGAFGSIGRQRHEVIVEGTRDEPGPDAVWLEYEFPCKPGDPGRAPCFVTPYHYRLQWQFWFASFGTPDREPWLPHLVWKLLEGNSTARRLVEHDPFFGDPPRAIRARLFVYEFTQPGERGWWTRRPVGQWLRPVTRDDPELRAFLQARGWLDD